MEKASIDDVFENQVASETFDRYASEVKEYIGDALAENLWNLKATQVYEARRLAQTNGEGVSVAIIDTGINYEHPQLKDSCSYDRGINFTRGGNEYAFIDTDGHGTFVTGIVAGRDFGIAPGVNVYAVKVSEKKVYNPGIIVDALEWCIHNSINIVNVSSGTPAYGEKIRYACGRANKEGLIIVSAAGNSSTGAFFPASYDEFIISVGAVDQNRVHSTFSNIWPTTDIVAPGKGIFSADSDENGEEKYRLSGGTSAAAPHITGILALGMSMLRREGKDIEPKELEEILKRTALSYSRGILKKSALRLAETYSQMYDPRRVYIRKNRSTIEAIYGAGLVQAKDFIEELMKTKGIKRKN